MKVQGDLVPFAINPWKNPELRQIYLCIVFVRGVYDGFMGQENQQHTKQSSPTFSPKKKLGVFPRPFTFPKDIQQPWFCPNFVGSLTQISFEKIPQFTTPSTLLVVSFHKDMSNWLISAEFLPFWGVKKQQENLLKPQDVAPFNITKAWWIIMIWSPLKGEPTTSTWWKNSWRT